MTATVIRLPRRPGWMPAQPVEDAEERSLRAELRRARVRIAQLEASLTEAMRDNVHHFERARAAEQRLAELDDRELTDTAEASHQAQRSAPAGGRAPQPAEGRPDGSSSWIGTKPGG